MDDRYCRHWLNGNNADSDGSEQRTDLRLPNCSADLGRVGSSWRFGRSNAIWCCSDADCIDRNTRQWSGQPFVDSADRHRWRGDFGLSDRTFGERWCLYGADCRYGLDRYVDSHRRTHERHDVCIPCECPYRWWCWRSFVADIGGAVYKCRITDCGDGSGCRKFGGSELDCAFIRRWPRDYRLPRRAVC